jgi:hypothetical protein
VDSTTNADDDLNSKPTSAIPIDLSIDGEAGEQACSTGRFKVRLTAAA